MNCKNIVHDSNLYDTTWKVSDVEYCLQESYNYLNKHIENHCYVWENKKYSVSTY